MAACAPANAPHVAHEVEGGGRVRPVVDRLADVGDANLDEAGCGEDGLDCRRVGQRERIRPSRRGRRTAGGQRMADGGRPLVPLLALPDHHDQTPPRPRGARDVGECCDRIGEEHRAEPADDNIEVRRREWVEMSTPTALPDPEPRAASRVDWPVPQPMSSTRSAGPTTIVSRSRSWCLRNYAS